MAYADWSSTADANSTVGGISIAEGMDPSLVNNAMRALMADLAAENLLGSTALSSTVQAYDASLQAIADHTTTITGVGGSDATLLSGTVGTDQSVPKWDADGSLVDGFTVSNDNTLVGNSATALVTEGAAKGYVDNFFLDQLTETASSGNLTNTIPYFDPTDTASTLNFRDEDDMASDDALGVPSQQSVVAYVSNNAVGSNQTWQNVTGSRSTGTIYQNTTGRTIEVALRGSGGSSRTFDIGTDAGSLSPILDFSDSGSEGSSISLLIPDQTYYRMESGASISSWWELR
jgi:hypothetical protein